MRILVTLSQLMLGGTETYSVTVGEQLERLGHPTELHAGRVAAEGRELAAARGLALRAGDPALLGDLEGFDAVLAQDAASAYAIAARRPDLPQAFVVHGFAGFEHPPPGLRPQSTVVALNERVANHAAALAARPPVVRLRQPIDIERFRPRGGPRRRARRVLLLSNYLPPERLAVLEKVCDGLGLELGHVGVGGARNSSPQDAIDAADIVVGYGRSVLEGMAMGRAAYVWDHAGGDGWVTPESYPLFEARGFNGAATGDVIDATRLREDLAAYSQELGGFGYDVVRTHHSAARHAEELVEVLGRTAAPVASAPPEVLEALALLTRAEARMANKAAELEGDCRRLGRELEAVHVAMAAEHKRHVAAVAELDAVRRSWSWRLLAPLRAVAGALRRGR